MKEALDYLNKQLKIRCMNQDELRKAAKYPAARWERIFTPDGMTRDHFLVCLDALLLPWTEADQFWPMRPKYTATRYFSDVRESTRGHSWMNILGVSSPREFIEICNGSQELTKDQFLKILKALKRPASDADAFFP